MAKAPGKQPPMSQDPAPWTSPLGSTPRQPQGAQAWGQPAGVRRTPGTAQRGTARCRRHAAPRCPRYPGAGSTRGQGACGAPSPSQHTQLYCTDTWGHTAPRHRKQHTKGELRPQHNTQPRQGAHSNFDTQLAAEPPRGLGTRGQLPGHEAKPKKKTCRAGPQSCVRAAELCPAPAAPGASPGCTPQPCARPAPWHHHGPGAHCCHSIPPSSDIEHLCLLLLPEGEAAVDVAADVLVTELPQLRDQLGRLLPSLGCSSGCQPGGRRT